MAVAVVNNDMLISYSAASTSRVEVRSVWAHNLDEEFSLIRSALPFHPFVALDTEYPGVVVTSKGPYCTLTLPQRYDLIRANVEALRIVQVGLTLSDAAGNLPCALYSDGTYVRYVWEFNFRDFDISRDRYAPSSVELLKANGIDFQKNQIWGIDSCRFAQHLATSGLLSFGHFSPVSWITFQGAYDFAFLVKMLTCDCELPKTVREFLHLVHFFFGKRVFDVKHLSKHCRGLYGGLERVASTVQVERAVGSRHQSGSDSLLTWQVFYQIASRVNPQLIDRPEHMGALFDLELQYSHSSCGLSIQQGGWVWWRVLVSAAVPSVGILLSVSTLPAVDQQSQSLIKPQQLWIEQGGWVWWRVLVSAAVPSVGILLSVSTLPAVDQQSQSLIKLASPSALEKSPSEAPTKKKCKLTLAPPPKQKFVSHSEDLPPVDVIPSSPDIPLLALYLALVPSLSATPAIRNDVVNDARTENLLEDDLSVGDCLLEVIPQESPEPSPELDEDDLMLYSQELRLWKKLCNASVSCGNLRNKEAVGIEMS
ncbi:hypothetical protein ZIOFF_073468 [Zingiber officinale]|uniref:poly(A)-specific ribonuclease n=2 Tax=Zingiber officinale TaxID=94328 RepID=A0A8J5C763_ZINOF|nr:hypothetical protein ZIOFF_073468 [Zingiber officinale]